MDFINVLLMYIFRYYTIILDFLYSKQVIVIICQQRLRKISMDTTDKKFKEIYVKISIFLLKIWIYFKPCIILMFCFISQSKINGSILVLLSRTLYVLISSIIIPHTWKMTLAKWHLPYDTWQLTNYRLWWWWYLLDGGWWWWWWLWWSGWW